MLFRLLAVALLITAATPALAGEAITEQMVATKNAELAKLLNDRQNTNGSTQYMHEHIAENAKFELSVNNPAMPEAASGQRFQMTKEDYINSYIQGPVYIAHYNIVLDSLTGASRDIITERGTLQSPRPDAKAGKDMVSTTTCETTHALKDGKLATTGAKCHTEVSFEESV